MVVLEPEHLWVDVFEPFHEALGLHLEAIFVGFRVELLFERAVGYFRQERAGFDAFNDRLIVPQS